MAPVETGGATVPILGLRQRRQFRQPFVVETGDVGELQQGRPALDRLVRDPLRSSPDLCPASVCGGSADSMVAHNVVLLDFMTASITRLHK